MDEKYGHSDNNGFYLIQTDRTVELKKKEYHGGPFRIYQLIKHNQSGPLGVKFGWIGCAH